MLSRGGIWTQDVRDRHNAANARNSGAIAAGRSCINALSAYVNDVVDGPLVFQIPHPLTVTYT